MKLISKTRARLEILHHICQFSLPQTFKDGKIYAYHTFTQNRLPKIGSLLALKCVPQANQFYLSWLHQIRGQEYLVESIEDGSFAWYSNVDILVYDEEVVAKHPEWRWTDDQFQFADKWKAACYKSRGAYITLPTGPHFGEGDSVTIGTRTRHALDNYTPSITFPDWRKVTRKMMLEFYDEAVASRPDKKGIA